MDELIEASKQRFRTLAPVEFSPESILPGGIRPDNLNDLIEAADTADSIFWKQLFPNGGRSQLARVEDDEELRDFFLFNYGPYDTLDNEKAALPVTPKLPGAGFYPESLSSERFVECIDLHPENAASFESPYTVIRGDNSDLRAIPYHVAYSDDVKHLSRLLTQASVTEGHSLFREFLIQRAADLLTDDYFESDSTWVRLVDNPLDLVIGPYEVYEDHLMGLKSSYEARILWRDFPESQKIQHFQQELPSLCKELGPELGKALVIGDSRLELSVADILYAGGFARKGIPAIALTLPNDERVIDQVGSRQIILKNILDAKFKEVAWPIVNSILASPLEDEEEARQSFFNHTLFHEISHSIGPHQINLDGEVTTVNRSLRQYYSVLEEAKADALGAGLLLCNSRGRHRGAFLDLFVGGFLRSIRYGKSHAHGGANLIQFNYLLAQGGFKFDSVSGKLRVNEELAHKAILKLAAEIINIQATGDFYRGQRLFETFCVLNAEIEKLLKDLTHIPIDIRIRYSARKVAMDTVV